MDKEFNTRDITLAATLVASDFNVEVKHGDGNRCNFLFEDSPELQEAIRAYWNQSLELEATKLFNALKNLKARIYGQR